MVCEFIITLTMPLPVSWTLMSMIWERFFEDGVAVVPEVGGGGGSDGLGGGDFLVEVGDLVAEVVGFVGQDRDLAHDVLGNVRELLADALESRGDLLTFLEDDLPLGDILGFVGQVGPPLEEGADLGPDVLVAQGVEDFFDLGEDIVGDGGGTLIGHGAADAILEGFVDLAGDGGDPDSRAEELSGAVHDVAVGAEVDGLADVVFIGGVGDVVGNDLDRRLVGVQGPIYRHSGLR